jgi:hypothetical protein
MAAPILPTPPLPELARAEGSTVSEMGEWFVHYYNTRPVPWNYRPGTRAIRASYRGFHKLPALLAGCTSQENAVGRSANIEIVRLAAPLAFERVIQVFDLSPRRFSFGRDRRTAYRIPFLFVEDGVVKVYFLQPRKGAGLSLEEFGMVATVVKKDLLDTEFFGLKTDVEFVDLSAPEQGGTREVREFNLATLNLWSEKRLADRLSLISEALDWTANSGRVEKRRRPDHRPEPEMPLFD